MLHLPQLKFKIFSHFMVQRTSYLSSIIQQQRVAFYEHRLYYDAHSDWMGTGWK
jgi:hypothetical protein